MKHLIETSFPAVTDPRYERERILKTHNLNRLMDCLKEDYGFQYSEETQYYMDIINGYYFSTRYPGDMTVRLDRDDITECQKAVEGCRSETLEKIRETERIAARRRRDRDMER